MAIPAVLLERLGLAIGDEVYFDVPEENPRFIRIHPAKQIEVAP